ncbi:TPA: outer membrane beta-barrel protein [Vibrio vulnificus]|nr:outer membrane beta-barrel protein [Vibrio vulnificus]HDY8016367.1 outer membrane beta-barrel protein [Vibrio vulnificus]
MKKITLLSLAITCLLPTLSYAQPVSSTAGLSYEFSNIKVGNTTAHVNGPRFQASSELPWGNIKGAAATLSDDSIDYSYYTLAIEKPIPLQSSNFYISPEAGITYADYSDNSYHKSDFGPEVGMSIGYNINEKLQVQSNYNHLFGMKSGEVNVEEDSVSLGVKYRFN